MKQNIHKPVLLQEVLSCFENTSGTIVDCTLGGTGHTKALLESSSNIRVLACDQDSSAIENAESSLGSFVESNRVQFLHENFKNLPKVKEEKLNPDFKPPWSGVLLDLGYSSNQLEDPDYGLSFLKDGPLDMRLSNPKKGKSAWDLIVEADADELGGIFAAYGELPKSHFIAKTIKNALFQKTIHNSTKSLATHLEKLRVNQKKKIHPATLVFQALRIAVNDELRVLHDFLHGIIPCLKPGAKIAIISFHSLEDRLVKRWGSEQSSQLKVLTKRPIIAKEAEISENSRSRSAKLRIYEKV